MIECVVTYSSNTIGDGNTCEVTAIIERIVTYSNYTGRYADACKRVAPIKCPICNADSSFSNHTGVIIITDDPISNVVYTVFLFHQRVTSFESILTNAFDAIWQRNTCEVTAITKRMLAYSSYTVRYSNTCEVVAIIERIVTYGSYTIRNDE